MVRGPSSERELRRKPSDHLILFHLPTFMARGPAYHCLSAHFAPVMARGPSSERALRRRPSYHSPFVSFTHLYGARPEQASFSLPFCPIWRAARAGQLIIALLLHIARGLSGPAHHCLAAPHSARPERASLSFARPERASLSYALYA